MAKSRNFTNPFYVLLIIAGVAFLITACAYGVMAYRDVALGAAGEPAETQGLLRFMAEHGVMVLGIEVLLLGLFTIGAIGTDEYWQRRESSEISNLVETNRMASNTTAQSHGGPEHEG